MTIARISSPRYRILTRPDVLRPYPAVSQPLRALRFCVDHLEKVIHNQAYLEQSPIL